MKWHSQNQEEHFITRFFKDYVGTFLDIGSNDGETLSNTRALALNGWKGVCVEPDPRAFEKLLALYATSNDVFCYPFAIGTESGTQTFYSSGTHLKNGDTGLLSTLKPTELKRWKDEAFKTIDAEVLTWEDFDELTPYATYDFVSIDAEGMDLEILKQMDLKGMETKLLCIEWNRDKAFKAEAREVVGGKIIYESPENLIFDLT